MEQQLFLNQRVKLRILLLPENRWPKGQIFQVCDDGTFRVAWDISTVRPCPEDRPYSAEELVVVTDETVGQHGFHL